MTDERVRCDSCKQMVYPDWPHSCYDFDAVERLRQCERDVIDKAKQWANHYGWQTDGAWRLVQHELAAAVRALDAAEGK